MRRHWSELESGDDALWDRFIAQSRSDWPGAHGEDWRRARRSLLADARRTDGAVRSAARNDRALLEDQWHTDDCLDGALHGGWRGDDLIAHWRAHDTLAGDGWLLAPDALREICEAEEITLASLYSAGSCVTCEGGSRCQRPLSLVSQLRLLLPEGGDEMSCDALVDQYVSSGNAASASTSLADCAKAFLSATDPWNVDNCPWYLLDLLDVDTGLGRGTQYSSSVFSLHTTSGLEAEFGKWGRGGEVVEGVYDTRDEYLSDQKFQHYLNTDMMLSLAAMLVVIVAVLLHSRSAWITTVGFAQVFLSFPTAYFMFYFILGRSFFPFLNFLGMFVIIGIGADDIFVAQDKWREAERALGPGASTTEVAAEALPSAAIAMFWTSATTAAAFFGTSIVPVPPIRSFALFMGCLVVCDYLLNVALVFPALCLQHRWAANCCASGCAKCCIECGGCCTKKSPAGGVSEDPDGAATLPFRARMMRHWYQIVHRARWLLLPASIGAIVWCGLVASTIPAPSSSEVKLLRDSHEFSKTTFWGNQLISNAVEQDSVISYVWGLQAAATSNTDAPSRKTKLRLDLSFDPSSVAAQDFLINFCARVDALNASYAFEAHRCVLSEMNDWLTWNETGVIDECGGARSLPVPPASFHGCARRFAESGHAPRKSMLFYKGKLQVLVMRSKSSARWDSPLDELRRAWNFIEDFMDTEREAAPVDQVASVYHTSEDFWWYDTNAQMSNGAYQSALIALIASAVVVALACRSLVLTLFSIVAIGFVLCAVAACTVAIGWELGFLESICFGILIGLSCDFVIHLCHAYVEMSPSGAAPRTERSERAICSIGPPILSSAATTFFTGLLLLACNILFFVQFGIVLVLTMIFATVGVFVVFLVLVDTLGPAQPTYLADKAAEKLACICPIDVAPGAAAAPESEPASNATAGSRPGLNK